MRIGNYITYVLASAGAIAGQQLGLPSLNYLGFMNITLGSFLTVGDVGLGQQVTIPITGGTVRGARVTGTISSFGGDYGYFDAKGIYHPDARLNIQTDDGALIYVQLAGSELATNEGQPDNRGILRVKYESGHTNYTWLNSVAATAMYEILGVIGHSTYLLVDAWETKPPQKKVSV
ncbi:uncharacterized protein TRIVIDRAFT_203086 [Trichoderma virens Gv29-8]|uniref:Uncharacterized protein n=1 Tax=Hypocrea virens (strain Gv29-8 / FGSC 10586) TaxID=413071 RepID=G9MZE1_HYPVG|nr:uncharacterized protein TRIVIDRAFT_203086 [Trichoderma virens Gv29-8]EHK19998.1 hypothetical protein TRIVIDRAFT_203086 [Trichoderma virens Gv29-8]UKZ46056.1 hypothetical protein TrVGV298_000253 [Trichoderma virens]